MNSLNKILNNIIRLISVFIILTVTYNVTFGKMRDLLYVVLVLVSILIIVIMNFFEKTKNNK